MFESQEDVTSFVSRSNSPRPPIYKRGTSNSENADSLLANYNFGEKTDDSFFSGNSSRLNSSMSVTIPKSENEPSFNTAFLEEDIGLDDDNNATTKVIISSLMSDSSSSRMPFDLNKEDFNAPSYSNRLLANAEGRFDQNSPDDNILKSSTISSNFNSSSNSSRLNNSNNLNNQLDSSLDHAMQKLYVSEDEQLRGRVATPELNHLSSNGHLSTVLSTNSTSSRSNLSRNVTSTVQTNSFGLHGNNDQNNSNVPMLASGAPSVPPLLVNPQVVSVPAIPQGPLAYSMPMVGNMTAPLQTQYIPMDNGMISNGQLGGTAPAAYYMPQQAVYFDQNGQPVYYRMGPPAQYPPDVIYTNPDGTPADPMQMSYMQMQTPANYWQGQPMSSHDPNQMPVGGPMYMQAGHNPMSYDANGMMRRVIYPNPQNLPYNSNNIPNNQSNTSPVGRGNMNNNNLGPNSNMYGVSQNQNLNNHQGRQQNGMINDDIGYHNVNSNRDDYHPNMMTDYRPDMMRNGSPGLSYNNNNMVNPPNNNSPMYNNGSNYPGNRNAYDEDRRDHYNNRNRNTNPNNNPRKVSPTNTNNTNVIRDSLVEEFRNTYGKTRQWNLRDLVGHVVAFCQDQHGSRFIQQRLEVCSDSEKQVVFDEIIPTANLLMTDVFGNYVLQKLFEFGASEQCDTLSSLLVGQSVQLSMQMYGCRVVQKALEYVTTPRLVILVREFENPQVLLNCVHDANGNHVIQKCIEIVSKAARESTDNEMQEYLNSRIQFIIDAFRGRVKELSSHPYGCRVVQRILEHCSNPQKSVILEELRLCCAELVQDCYGNYVIQFVMQHGWEADRAILIKEVHTHLLDFSQHKFASNVVEKCLQYASKRDRDEMIWKIINVTFDTNSPIDGKGNSALETMVRDPYANYVVQKVIDVSDDKQRGAILRYVRENITQLRRYTYGKHIILRLEKITNEKF
mmetsp:Transcript_10076/g.9030  ORF Transcript_10076/g.9030 Transcript_10076/m.9030 type:complete len:953 (-) Transcript_10076:446-3304(-)